MLVEWLFKRRKRSLWNESDSKNGGIDMSKLPVHIGIIMDGNGRWAKQRGLPRSAGHKAGADSIRDMVRACREFGVRVLTLYAFSTENWNRPKDEVEGLMDLLVEYLAKETSELNENGVKIRFIGDLAPLRENIQSSIRKAEALTKDNQHLILNIAVNYGGRHEILHAVRAICAKMTDEATPDIDAIDEAYFSEHLYTAGLPDPDLIIRPGGEMRISNFLIWQAAYAELWVTSILWPDFNRQHLISAIVDYQNRERRFGKVGRETDGGHDDKKANR